MLSTTVLYTPYEYSHASYVQSLLPYKPAYTGMDAFAVMYCALVEPVNTTAGTFFTTW